MVYYIFLSLFCVVSGLFAKVFKTTKGPLLLSILFFFLFFAFREGFTPDYYNYDNTFDYLHGGTIDQGIKYEIGFQWLCQILPSYRALLVFFTGLFCVCLYVVFEKFIPRYYWPLSLIVLFFYPSFALGNMSGLRSGLVTCLFFFATLARYTDSSNKGFFSPKMLIAMSLMVIAFMLHRSAIVLLPLLFIPSKPLNGNMTKVVYIIVAMLVLIVYIFINRINTLSSLLVSDWFGEDYYDAYFEGVHQVHFTVFSLMKMLVVIVLMGITFKISNSETDRIKNIFLKFTAVFYFIAILPDVGLIARLLYYFVFPCIIGTAYVIQKAKGNTKIIYLSCIAIYTLWQVYNFSLSRAFVYYLEYDNVLF